MNLWVPFKHVPPLDFRYDEMFGKFLHFRIVSEEHCWSQESVREQDEGRCAVRPRVKFTNVLQAAFTCADPKSNKKTIKLSSFLRSRNLCERKS